MWEDPIITDFQENQTSDRPIVYSGIQFVRKADDRLPITLPIIALFFMLGATLVIGSKTHLGSRLTVYLTSFVFIIGFLDTLSPLIPMRFGFTIAELLVITLTLGTVTLVVSSFISKSFSEQKADFPIEALFDISAITFIFILLIFVFRVRYANSLLFSIPLSDSILITLGLTHGFLIKAYQNRHSLNNRLRHACKTVHKYLTKVLHQVRARKESEVRTYIYISLIIIINFFALFYLTLLFSISASPYLIGFVLLYVVFFPFVMLIRHSFTYFILLPVPYLGSWVLSIVFLSSFAIPILLGSILVSLVPIVLATFIHLFSRMRSMIRRVPMMSVSRSGAAFISALFFMIGTLVLGPTPIQLITFNKTIFYGALLCAYTSFSMLYVNSAYRYRLICREFKTNRVEPKILEIWNKIRKRFSDREKDVDLLRYYFADALRYFEEGGYEIAFTSGYKVINEPTVVDPKDYITDKRDGKPSSFSEIRTILMHSRRREVEIDVTKIRETKRELPQYCLELLKKCFNLLSRLTTQEN